MAKTNKPTKRQAALIEQLTADLDKILYHRMLQKGWAPSPEGVEDGVADSYVVDCDGWKVVVRVEVES